jgi:hypothetical protein
MKCLGLNDPGINGVETCVDGNVCIKTVNSKKLCAPLTYLDPSASCK